MKWFSIQIHTHAHFSIKSEFTGSSELKWKLVQDSSHVSLWIASASIFLFVTLAPRRIVSQEASLSQVYK